MQNSFIAITFRVCSVFLILTAIGGAQSSDSSRTLESEERFIVETRHRLFPNFRQVDTVSLGEVFLVGEEELKAEILKFNPHLGITDSGKYLQMSDTLYNPAVLVRLTLEDGRVQESWGFYVMDAPHYRRDNLFGFKLVDFKVGDKYIKLPEEK
ncbi:MAG: hypothetical protein HRF51_10255 [bacterium]|jgi:hypothetical protein